MMIERTIVIGKKVSNIWEYTEKYRDLLFKMKIFYSGTWTNVEGDYIEFLSIKFLSMLNINLPI